MWQVKLGSTMCSLQRGLKMYLSQAKPVLEQPCSGLPLNLLLADQISLDQSMAFKGRRPCRGEGKR